MDEVSGDEKYFIHGYAAETTRNTTNKNNMILNYLCCLVVLVGVVVVDYSSSLFSNSMGYESSFS